MTILHCMHASLIRALISLLKIKLDFSVRQVGGKNSIMRMKNAQREWKRETERERK